MSSRPPTSRHHRWFLPEVPDLLGLLSQQGAATVDGLAAFVAWAKGDPASADAVRSAGQRAASARRELFVNLRWAFVTPVGPEDVFELAERLDAILEGAKNVVLEADVLALLPDSRLAEMGTLVEEGVRTVVNSFAFLVDEPDLATASADQAAHLQGHVDQVYRKAMKALLAVDDNAEVQSRRELYRGCSHMGTDLGHLAHRIWYAVVKES